MGETVQNTPLESIAPIAKPALAPSKPTGKGLTLTDGAVVRLKALLTKRNTPNAGLRVAVKGGGCSGLSYQMEWAEQPRERDKIFERDGVRVFVDPKSFIYLDGSTLEYQTTMMGRGFKFTNPNVKGTCGCGESVQF